MSTLQRERVNRTQSFEHHVRSARWRDRRGEVKPIIKTVTYSIKKGKRIKKTISQPNPQYERICFIAVSLVLTWNQLRRDMGCAEISDGDLKRWLNAVCSEPFEETLGTLKDALEVFDDFLSDGTILAQNWGRFKHALKEKNGVIAALQLVRPIVELVFVGNGDTRQIRVARQALGIARKTALNRDDDEMSQAAIENFRVTDARCSHRLAGRGVKAFFAKIFDGLRLPYEWEFRHGNGSTQECHGRISHDIGTKYASMQLSRKMAIILSNLGYDFVSTYRLDDDGEVALLHAVLKDARKYRTITFEPTLKQYLQQGGATVIWDKINADPYLHRRMWKEHGAERGDRLARIGSERGDYATIDLSNASDLLAWGFVFSAISCNPRWQMFLEACRSSAIMLSEDGPLLIPRKWAGMGNAMTFAFLSISMCGIIEETLQAVGVDPQSSHYSVHGDDIVIETAYAEPLMKRLEYYGFEVNRTKSFYKKSMVWNFRESCGGFYLDGRPVDIMRLPREINPETNCILMTTWPAQQISLANDAFMYGLGDLRNWLVSRMLKYPKTLRPGFTNDPTDTARIFTPGEVRPVNHKIVRSLDWNGVHLPNQFEDRIRYAMTLSYERHPKDGLGTYFVYDWLRQFANPNTDECPPGELNRVRTPRVASRAGLVYRVRWKKRKIR